MDVAHQAPLSVGFSRQEDWSGQPFSSPGDFPDPRIELVFPALHAESIVALLLLIAAMKLKDAYSLEGKL